LATKSFVVNIVVNIVLIGVPIFHLLIHLTMRMMATVNRNEKDLLLERKPLFLIRWIMDGIVFPLGKYGKLTITGTHF